MSADIRAAAVVQLRDAGRATSISVTTSEGTTLLEDYAGEYVRVYNPGADVVYLSAGSIDGVTESGTVVSAANGFEVAAGAFQDIYVPHDRFLLRHIGAAVATLKLVPCGA